MSLGELLEELGKFEIAALVANLEAENQRLREALTFYSDPKNYLTINQPVNAPSTTWNYETTNVMEDEGERARKALEGAVDGT